MEQKLTDFKNSQSNELLTLFSNNGNMKNNKFKLEFNTYYNAELKEIKVITNNENYPIIIVNYNIILDDNQSVEYIVRYPLTDSGRFKKMHDLISLINALHIDKYSLCTSSVNDKELLLNVVDSINKKKGSKIKLMKNGKPSYYNYEVYPYEQ